ncbi:hypothetical protein H1Q58_03275 [Planococcus maritimus]|uniref:Uncharacterized protein n=1 Tax=Planococcus maritimus TaxID=192421 RepID=A0A7D7R1K1_PLAMR|nr:hypothetical protein [Planococcus maritimus]QMT18056.1 hypothetical protein H1Q58_03275 [Planococcus maritimus]
MMKSTGHVFLMLGFIFLILSFTGDMSPALGIAFLALGMIYSSENAEKKAKKPKGHS